LFQPKAIRTPEALEEFRSLDADAAVVVAYGRILPEGFLNAFPRGAINVHFSLLPKYRGAAPVNWAIVNGETETGVTTMKMDAGLDTGDILLVKRTAIGADENAEELMERLAVIGADAIVETLERLGELRPIPQDNSDATFAPIMKRGDGEIDWTMSAKMIANRVRGFRPFPGTFSTFRGTKIGIVSASATEAEAESGEALPGEIVKAEKGTLLAACGEHTILKIDEAKPEGKRAMSAADLINGMHPKPGERFGV
jgi:methionyl-tRNA formyltransferase